MTYLMAMLAKDISAVNPFFKSASPPSPPHLTLFFQLGSTIPDRQQEPKGQ